MPRLQFKLLFGMILLLSTPAIAQRTTLWEGSPEQLEKLREGGQKKVSKIKAWKAHVEQWGLDSNHTHALSLSGRLHTNGWSGGLQYRKQTGAGRATVWQIHFSGIKHEKETRQKNASDTWSGLGERKPYVFGKVNNAYTLQVGYGREQLVFPALVNGNLSLSFRYVAGPALALLKPYYLQLVYVDFQPEEIVRLETEKYNPQNAEHFLGPQNILAPAKWSTGIGEIRLLPGLFAEGAVVLEPNRARAFVKSITLGAKAAFYSKPIELIAETRAHPYQLSFFVGLGLGKRWK